jgi:hypothetical protein
MRGDLHEHPAFIYVEMVNDSEGEALAQKQGVYCWLSIDPVLLGFIEKSRNDPQVFLLISRACVQLSEATLE